MLRLDPSPYIRTENGNAISRSASLHGIQNIVLKGNTIIDPFSIIRGDLRRQGAGSAIAISIGKYTRICSKVVIKPPLKEYKGNVSYYPIKIGDYVRVGEETIIEGASIGESVLIGKRCVIGEFAVIKDDVEIVDETIIPPHTVIPSFTRVSGRPRNLD